ncbi:type II secretion system protein G (GspG) [Ekhidna lutea]|uniref:Type II secretion system protein G (GspG) n=1 Tax=Ekhidna lutea TaxID=447679 RepID=A0A239K8J9_EKHLU|nr:prepilin-type N-terminal cleavage/methylation domain-containing protein [Ekhidna lutea]SNT14002.1 type II secretion system protein G (GspG) [Ekhidna lutea]
MGLKNKKVKAFTLSELLVVLVIVGILILIALPQLMPLITRARSVEAKQALKHLHTLQRTHFFEYSRYSNNIQQIGFEQEPLVTSQEGGNANYIVEIINASPQTFQARATAVVDFDGDGQFNVWEIDEKGQLIEVVPD